MNAKIEDGLLVRFRSLEKQPNLEKYGAKQDNLMGFNYTWFHLN